jgi:pimeloyl-ACP methyl ester carboxylesterase
VKPTLVVILHGMNASPEWGFFPEVARRLAIAGFASLRVALAGATPTEDVDHVHRTITHFQNHTLHFLGHSRGGAVAQIVASERARSEERVAVWSGIGTWLRAPIRTRLPVHEDLDANADRLSIVEASRALRGRVRYLHAAEDLVVKPREVQAMLDEAGNVDALTMFTASTHTFGITHPMTDATGTFLQAISSTINFLRT